MGLSYKGMDDRTSVSMPTIPYPCEPGQNGAVDDDYLLKARTVSYEGVSLLAPPPDATDCLRRDQRGQLYAEANEKGRKLVPGCSAPPPPAQSPMGFRGRLRPMEPCGVEKAIVEKIMWFHNKYRFVAPPPNPLANPRVAAVHVRGHVQCGRPHTAGVCTDAGRGNARCGRCAP